MNWNRNQSFMLLLLRMKLVVFFLGKFSKDTWTMVQDNSVKQASLNHVIVEVYSVICDDFQLSLNGCFKWRQNTTLDLYSLMGKNKFTFNVQQLFFCTAWFIPKETTIWKVIQNISSLIEKNKSMSRKFLSQFLSQALGSF